MFCTHEYSYYAEQHIPAYGLITFLELVSQAQDLNQCHSYLS